MNTPTPIGTTHTIALRVRYSDTDQMGTYYNSRPLEWFECGRTELLRSLDLPYAALEERGLFLPLVEAHLEYLGRARYDDLIHITTIAAFEGRARLRCSVQAIDAATKRQVVRGYTIHAFTNASGRPIRPPAWLLERFLQAHPGRGPGAELPESTVR
jgi:acyl-CoA thioester hydrolase